MTPYDPAAGCPKCCSTAVETTYYPATAHKGCPLYGQNYIIAQNISPIAFGSDFYGKEYPDRDEMRQHYWERMKADEHFDRLCKRCGFGWVEGLADCGAAA